MGRAKLIIIVGVGLIFLTFGVKTTLFKQPKSSPQPSVQPEVERAEGALRSPKARDRAELIIEIKPDNPTWGTARLVVSQLDRQGRPVVLAVSATFDVFRPHGNFLELADLDGDGDDEIMVASGTEEEKGELRIYDFREGELAWFCRLPTLAACQFPYRFNRPMVVDLDDDQLAEVIVYGPHPLDDNQFNFDRYSVYRIYIFQNGFYYEAKGTKLAELGEAFARYSRLPLVPLSDLEF